MRILVLGAGGMLGHMACRVLAERHEVFGTTRKLPEPNSRFARFLPKENWICGVDSFRFDTVVAAIAETRPQAVINCIGIVKQLKEAKDPMVSIECNSMFPQRLSVTCATAGAKLVHMSTDCVFSGRKGMYTEEDNPDPVDLYGRTKLLGETHHWGALTLRTSIVGRQLTGSTGLFEWLLSQRGGWAKGFSRAIYTGLTTSAMVRVIEQVLTKNPDLSGVWQVASEPINKLDLISRLNKLLNLGISITEDQTFACDRSLDGSRFAEKTGIKIPTWDEMLAEFAKDNSTYEEAAG